MEDIEFGTANRIMLIALRLMQERGFKSVSIKEIAQTAEVSQMTVFRHYETKISILEAAVKHYSYLPNFNKIFFDKILWDLELDLQLISQTYLESMERNMPIFLIAVQERITMPELANFILNYTKQLKEYIAKYFIIMQEKKKIIKNDPNDQALVFLTMLYGYFSSTALWDTLFVNESREQFIRTSVATFCNGIKK